MEYKQVFKSNGFYLGFIKNGYLFSRDGIYLGWVEGNFVWDSSGQFRGMIYDIAGHTYILNNRFMIPPVARPARPAPTNEAPPPPPANIPPVSLKVEFTDAFK